MSLRFRTPLMISYYPLFDSSLKIEIRKRNCPIIPTGISRELTISKFTSFVNRKFLVNHICSDYLILFVTLIFFSLRHGNISRERLDLGTFGTFLFPYLKLSIIFISFFFLFSFFYFFKSFK